MKIIIPYRDFNGPELRYCLRGIEKFIDNPEITIIGDKPYWIRNVTHIPFKDNPLFKYKSRNIYEKIKGHENFLFMNDDHFLLKRWENKYHYSGTIKGQFNNVVGGAYKQTLQNTLDVYGDIKNFDTHCPIYYKELYIDERSSVDWNKGGGYCIKSIYCHLNGIEGEEYPDLKIRRLTYEKELRELIKDRPYFSTGDILDKPVITVLNELYPYKSKYES